MICIFSFSIYPFTKDLVPYLNSDHRHVSSQEYFLMLE